MSLGFSTTRLAILAALLALAASGCTYDYLARSDRIAYSAGDAVNANLEQETINPSSRSMYVTKGLGKNGVVIPKTSGISAGGSTAVIAK